MKHFWGIPILILTLLAWSAAGATDVPVKLAIVPESAAAATAVDLLTAELSKNDQVQLLERAEIDKVYREQSLSAGNRDYLKLGQILGADGLLLVASPRETNNLAAKIPFTSEKPCTLNVRLIAVKPGVVLFAQDFSFRPKDLAVWSTSMAAHLETFLPKLAVLERDAIPISLVNFRVAVASAEAPETERQLKALIIQRLSREPRLFVLERQRLAALSEEKELQTEESPFWDGRYLLEGVVDQNGFAQDTITVSARLTPPKTDQPLSLAASGPRTNLAVVVNSLADKLNGLLNFPSQAGEWKAADEATQYFREAQWALRWEVYAEAQMAADSAWALGQRDVACAQARIQACLGQIPAVLPDNRTLFAHGKIDSHYVHRKDPPDPHSCELALAALQCFWDFPHPSATRQTEILSADGRGPGWRDSEWYQAGVQAVEGASQVLQQFYLHPEAQASVANQLSELRQETRAAAELMWRTPSIHDSYFVGDRIATRDELTHTLGENPSIFSCAATWGCFWQERPEDAIALYRELMRSPVFCYLHHAVWDRESIRPRLVAWAPADEDRLPALWSGFLRELAGSTNVLWQMEAKGFLRTDATNAADARAAEAAWWSIVRAHRQELVANNVELFYLGWGFAANAETEAMDQDYWQMAAAPRVNAADLETQKQYLAGLTPYDFQAFHRVFAQQNYTRDQAAEIQPLFAAYQSNLQAQVSRAGPLQKLKLEMDVDSIEHNLAQAIKTALKAPPQASSPPVAGAATAAPLIAARPPAPRSNPPAIAGPIPAGEDARNVLAVSKFLPVPLDGLAGGALAAVTITAHHWQQGRLLLDLRYESWVPTLDEKKKPISTRCANFSAIAILDVASERWQVIRGGEIDPAAQNGFYHRTALCGEAVYTSDGGRIAKYDLATKQWQKLDIPDAGNCELFAISNRLFAATSDLVAEILDGGRRTHILASNRRQPPASALDTENLGTPVLFAGPDQAVRAAVANKIVAWNGTDWQVICPAPSSPLPPMISGDTVLFLAMGGNTPAGLWRLPVQGDQVEFCLGQTGRPSPVHPPADAGRNSTSRWPQPHALPNPWGPAACRGTDLFELVDHAKTQPIVDEERHLIIGRKVLPQDGYHAELLCFANDFSTPQKVCLRFESEAANLPVTGESRPAGVPALASGWLLFTTNSLVLGRETPDRLAVAASRTAKPPAAGVWLVSLAPIDAEIKRQRSTQRDQQDRTTRSGKQAPQVQPDTFKRPSP